MWDYFDSILVLTVDPNGTRIQQLKENLKENQIVNYEICTFPKSDNKSLKNESHQVMKFKDFIQHGEKSLGPIGQSINQNHISLINRAYDAQMQRVIILEDDAHFDVELTNKYLPSIIKWMKKHDDKWEVFNFGAISCPNPIVVPVARGVGVGKNPLLAHAIAFSRQGMCHFLQFMQTAPELHIDKLYSMAFKPYHVACPPICFQSVKPALFQQGLNVLPNWMATQLSRGDTFQFIQQGYFRMFLALEIVAVLFVLSLVFLKVKKRASH